KFDDRGRLLPSESSGLGSAFGAIIGVAAAAFLLMSGAMYFYLKNDKQTVTIEVDADYLKQGALTLSINKETVTIDGVGKTITLKPGEYGYEVHRGSEVVQSPRTFIVRKGERNLLTIGVMDNQPAQTATASTTSPASTSTMEDANRKNPAAAAP